MSREDDWGCRDVGKRKGGKKAAVRQKEGRSNVPKVLGSHLGQCKQGRTTPYKANSGGLKLTWSVPSHWSVGMYLHQHHDVCTDVAYQIS